MKDQNEIPDGLVVDKLCKTYSNRSVVSGVSMRLKPNEVVGLLGPNGAGKTTCFGMIAGLTRADSGTMYLHQQNITHFPMYMRARMGVGYLPQESSIFRGLSVGDNIMVVLEAIYTNLEDAEKRLDELLAEFSISHLKYVPAVALSGGERRRLEIARALASNPKFILLDEPLAGIDPVAVSDIKYLISHLKDKHIGVLITDHNVREMLEIVDRAYIMYDGKVLMEGTPSEIIAHERVRSVYLGDGFRM
ncbi:MAG: LPS export ABC transporter ATP-binding protein [Rickettsiaceae bacterium]|nr:LPS export ABC transporter ATP-binding protein [Rickettsiaceae bacterium]